MSATSTNAFPLATETSIPDDTIGGDAAGASGSAKGALEISQGGMIAIIVIVSVVAVLGSKISQPLDVVAVMPLTGIGRPIWNLWLT